MSERSDELTRSSDSRSTGDIIEETERLLAGELDATGDRQDGPTTQTGDSSDGPSDSNTTETVDQEGGERDRSKGSGRLSALVPNRLRAPSLDLKAIFSLRAFLVVSAIVAVGMLVAEALLPVGGRLVGMTATAFLVGLVGSKRRYTELVVVGVTVGGVATFLDNTMLAMLGIGQTLVAVGAGLGVIACGLGYYFGRDLKDGLNREIK